MNLLNYMHLVPEIERRMRVHRIDTLVCGMGPTAHLVPWLSRDVLDGVRVWGAHDVWRILPVDDLVIMDPPAKRLAIGSEAHEIVLKSRPKRLWFHGPHLRHWEAHLHRPMLPLAQKVDFYCWHSAHRADVRRKDLCLDNDPPDTIFVSPTGTATLAWREGCRRIGVIGADMRDGDHHTFQHHKVVGDFFQKIGQQAHERGGCIVNLSPITSLGAFEAWTAQSESTSAATSGRKEAEPSACSNTASASTAACRSTSTSCDPVQPDGKSASEATTAPGA